MDMINKYSQLWNEISVNKSDPRTADMFMMESPMPSLVICLAYFVLVIQGQKFMENRKPIQMKNVLILYNFFMVGLSSYIFYEFLMSGWLFDYSLSCQPVDYSRSPQALRMTRVCWLFYFSKFIELLDTVFFIMRKKFNQITFLHVFHHGIMPISWWFGVKFVPGGFGTFHSTFNSFIHILMYFYYGLAALGDEYKKYLFWKKYMTSMQMIQFLVVMLHSSQLLFIKCDYPKIFVYWIGSYAIIFLIFFANFYIQEYYVRSKKASKKINNKKD